MVVRIPNSRGYTKAWESYPQLEGLHQRSVSPTQVAKSKHGRPYPQLTVSLTLTLTISRTRGGTPKRGSLMPHSRGYTKAWESVSPIRGATAKWGAVSPTRGATPKPGSSYAQLEGLHQSVGVRIPHSRGYTKVRESYPQIEGLHGSVGVRIPNSRGHAKA